MGLPCSGKYNPCDVTDMIYLDIKKYNALHMSITWKTKKKEANLQNKIFRVPISKANDCLVLRRTRQKVLAATKSK